MNTILSAIGKRLPKRIDFTDSYGLGAVIGLFFIFLFVACAWFVSTYEKGYPVPSGYMRIMEDGELVSAQELLTKKQMAHSKLVPMVSRGFIETSTDVHDGFKTIVSYTVLVTLMPSKETQQMLASMYDKLPRVEIKPDNAPKDSDPLDTYDKPDTPQPILELVEKDLHPAAERLVIDLKNNSTSGSISDLDVRFRQIFETHDMMLPRWVKHVEVGGTHVNGWEKDN
jgi:hypothetical protein